MFCECALAEIVPMHCTYAFATSKRLSDYLVLGGLNLSSLNMRYEIARLQRSGARM